MKELRKFIQSTLNLGIISRGYWLLRLSPSCGMEPERSSWPGKLIDFREAPTRSCCAHWQPHMPRQINFGKAIERARTATQLARTQGEAELATELDREIALYERGLPYRETVN